MHRRILAGIISQLFVFELAAANRDVEWRSYASDGASSKYVSLDQINAGNVGQLEEKWVWNSADNEIVERVNADGLKLWPHAFETTPLMVDGTLYVSTSMSQVAAIDATTGRTLWVHDPKSYLSADGKIVYPPNVGLVQRGVAYWKKGSIRRVYLATGSGQLISLDARTGQPDTHFGQSGVVDLKKDLRNPAPQPFYGSTSPPLVCGGAIIVGSTVLDFPLQKPMPPGDVRAYDPSTGKLLWTFHTIPQGDEPGSAEWDLASRVETGGANVWAPMSCDTASDTAYLPVSTPNNDFYGGNRIGNNAHGDSLVAVNAKTGHMLWNFQLVHHGLWDYDPPAAPNLLDIKVNRRRVKAIAQVTKQGFVYVLDRTNGKPIWPINEQAVPQSNVPGEKTSATQPIPAKPAPFDRQGLTEDDLIDFTPQLRQKALATVSKFSYGPLFTPPVENKAAEGGKLGMIMVPGTIGGSSWAGAAVNPRTGTLYVPSITRPAAVVLSPYPPARLVGASVPLQLDNGLPLTKPPYGRLTAIDLNSGNHLWMKPVGNGPIKHPELSDLGLKDLGWDRRSFFIVTDSLLFGVQEGIIAPKAEQLSRLTVLFSAKDSDPFLWALDPRTGEKVFEMPLAHGNATGSPMTYRVNGKQFIVIPFGGAGQPAKLVGYALP